MSTCQAPKYDQQKLQILVDLREAVLSFGLTGRSSRGSVAACELGKSNPRQSRRVDFINYLLDKLGLRRNYQKFQEV